MPRHATVCRQPGCPNLRPCPTPGHEPRPWAGSTRRATLPSDWNKRRARILRRNPVCQHCHAAAATDVDHIADRHNHDDTNLQALCRACHTEKTNQEAAEGRRRGRTPR